MKVVRTAVVQRSGEHRRCRRDQPLMVKERSTERTLKEKIGDDVIRRI